MTGRVENVLPGRFADPGPDVALWPALRGALPRVLGYERGIWGKAQGAGSDFRWLARSAGFADGQPDLGRRLNLGLEDRPRAFTAWSVTGGAGWAVAAYPSRAADAAGRRGFLEKQVFEWRRRGEPAAAVALVLLAAVARTDDEVWWRRRNEADWTDPEFALDWTDSGSAALELTGERLSEHVSAGLTELRARLDEDSLTELYATLLAERAPACLRQDEPLPPRALACLLLPLPRELADRISLMGWIPSRRYALDDLARRWDVIVGPVHESSLESREPIWAEARRMARAVLAADPGELGAEESEVTELPDGGERPAKAAVHEFPATSSWDEWTAAMRRNLHRTTDRLIEQGVWPVWRDHARLQPRERLTTALAWLTSEVWSRPEAPDADVETWSAVVDDVAVLKSAHVRRICAGGVPTWPWIPSHESRQIADLAAMGENLGDLARLAESIAADLPVALDSKPVWRSVLEESRFAKQLPADALLWLLEARPAEPPALDTGEWELLSREAGDRLDVALAARDIPGREREKEREERKPEGRWRAGLLLAVVVIVLLIFTLR